MINKNQLLQVVSEWVREAALPKFIPREVPQVSVKGLRQILAVVGPRRSGKTYYLFQLVKELLDQGTKREEILFLDFEDYRLEGFRPLDMEDLLAAFQQVTGKAPRVLFLDEIQHVPGWNRLVRTLHNRGRYVVVISGSNSSLLAEEIATELRGRYREERLLPFSFKEFLKVREVEAHKGGQFSPERGQVLKAFDEYLQVGGFPELLSEPDLQAKRKRVQEYYKTMFYKDILERHHIKAREVLEPMMREIVEHPANVFSISAYAKQLKGAGLSASKRTVANYLRFLEEAFFVLSLEKFSYSPRRRMMNPRKVFLMDSGFSLISGGFSENRGAWLENVVAVEGYRRGMSLYYFKEKFECDVVVQEGVRPSEAWQVCWEVTPRNEPRECRGLWEAMKSLRIKTGGILTYDQEEIRVVNDQRVQLVPVWKWLLETKGR